MRSAGYGSTRLCRSSSVGALEARRRQVAAEVRNLQQGDVFDPSGIVEAVISDRGAAAKRSEAAVCRVELWAQHVADHTELVARAMDLDRVTADAITESQLLTEASRVARWEKHGLGPHPDGDTAISPWYSRHLQMSPSLHISTSALESPRGIWRSEAPYSRHSSAVDVSQSSLGLSLVPETSRLSSSRLPETSRLSSSRVLHPPAVSAWMHERPLSLEPIRPAIYSASSPRRRHRTDLQSHLPGSPFRPVLPNRSEAGYALESPRQLSPYWQHRHEHSPNWHQSPLSGSLHGSTLRGGGISEIRAKRERLALEMSHSFESPRQSPSQQQPLRPTLLGVSMAEIKARRDRVAREVAKLNSNSLATTWRSPWASEA